LRKRSIVIRPGEVELVLETPIAVQGAQPREAEKRLMEGVHAAIRKHYVDQ
jgi:hypothetical protein